MVPLDFLQEEVENVERALGETLRHDYGPERSKEYYGECAKRLAEIKKIIPGVAATDATAISTHLGQLFSLAMYISLIERSHLGEFSWPFADELRTLATALLAEVDLKGDPLKPIVHVVSEGRDYRIYYEPEVPPTIGERRFVVIAFPRSLKHHVLLHALFGHEVGHTALHTARAGVVLKMEVVPALISAGPLANEAAANAWLHSPAAPQQVKDTLQKLAVRLGGKPFDLPQQYIVKWLIELTCDLFGLLLFGPAFLAAHRTLLEPLHPSPYSLSATHPPYAVRHKMLLRLLRLAGWNVPVTDPAWNNALHAAEVDTLNYLLNDPYDAWADIFTDAQLTPAIAGIRKIFANHGAPGYTSITQDVLNTLVGRLTRGLPPIIADIEEDGKPKLSKIDIAHTLYAGWVYWEGRSKLAITVPLNFFKTNRLCDHALLQQCAINKALSAGIP